MESLERSANDAAAAMFLGDELHLRTLTLVVAVVGVVAAQCSRPKPIFASGELYSIDADEGWSAFRLRCRPE
jgi:hypothetical protein